MRRFLLLFGGLFALFCGGAELKTWTFESRRDLLGDRMTFYAASGAVLTHELSDEKTPAGEPVLKAVVKQVPAGAPIQSIQICFLYRGTLEKGRRYRIQFQYRGSQNGEIRIVPAQARAPFAPLGKNTSPVLSVSPEWQTCTLDFVAERAPDGPYALPRMMLGHYPQGGVLFLGPVVLSETPEMLPLALSPMWRLKQQDGSSRTISLKDNTFLVTQNGKNPPVGTPFVFLNEFESPREGMMQIGVSADWWFTASINGKKVYSTERYGNQSKQFLPTDHIFNFPVKPGKNTFAITVRAGSDGCRLVCGAVPFVADPDAARRLFTVTESARYRPLPNDRYLVKKGTALDFSELNGKRVPAGTLGRVIVNSAGKLAFEKRPHVPVRFIAMNYLLWYWRLEAHRWTRGDIERFADAVAAQGYNLIRIHYLNRYLVGYRIHQRPHRTIAEAGLPQSAEEMPIDPGNLDRFDYLLKCFKERGIYVNLDLMNAPGYSMAYRQGPGESFRADLFVSPRYRKHWEAAVQYLMNHRNPYTGTRLKDEPTVAFVNFFNEQDFRLADKTALKRFQKPFREWLRKKYRTESALAKAWGRPLNWEEAGRIDEAVLRRGDAAARDTGDFLIGTMREMTEWYFRTLREAGYPGLFQHWDMIMRTMEVPARSLMPVIAQHTYFAHPNKLPTRNLVPKCQGALYLGGRDVDTTVSQESSLNSSYFRSAATARFLDRPYLITEYSHSAFNRYRHERGLYFGSYAALQGWDNLTPHGQLLRLTVDPIWTFEQAMDPISRASEVVVALTFLRGDVREAPHSVGLLLKNANLFPANYLAAVSDDYGKLAMLTKVGLLYPEGTSLLPVGTVQPTLMVEPKSFSPLRVTDWYVSADNSDGTDFPALLARLRETGILPSGNRTSWSRRIYQSETGELTLDAKRLSLTVSTPRLAGAVLKQGDSVELPGFAVRNVSVAASLVAASLNARQTLHEADRVLLTVATNAFNTNMTFENPSMFCCVNPGELPVLMESIRCTIELKTSRERAPRVYALHLDGTRFAEIPCELRDSTLLLRLDTSGLKYGTPFFEIDYKEGKTP